MFALKYNLWETSEWEECLANRLTVNTTTEMTYFWRKNTENNSIYYYLNLNFITFLAKHRKRGQIWSLHEKESVLNKFIIESKRDLWMETEIP